MSDSLGTSPNRLLEIRNLRIEFASADETFAAVKGAGLSINKGEAVGLVGESGSGKSVTASAVLQLLPEGHARYADGEILFEGKDLLKLTGQEMRRIRGKDISMIFQEPMSSLNPLHDVRRQIAEIMHIHKTYAPAKIVQRVGELLDMVGLSELTSRKTCYPHQISGGQQQRIMIAMALANQPKLLIADEPTTALDVMATEQILTLLKNLSQETGVSVLFITHDLAAVSRFCQHVFVMKDGEIVESGAAHTLFTTPQHPYTKALVEADAPGIRQTPETTDEKVLLVKNLDVKYVVSSGIFSLKKKYAHILKNISFEVQGGKTLGIVGESGSGKSTLAKAILRLTEYTGQVRLMDRDVSKLSRGELRSFRRMSGLVSQDPLSSLSPKMLVRSIVTEGLRIHFPKLNANERERKLREMLTEMGLDPDVHSHRYPFEFSGGQRQRISIARSLIYGPKFIILDEPTSALDKTIQFKILELLILLQKKFGLTYLFISHDLKVIRAVSDEILVLKNGEIVEFGKTEEIFLQPKHPYTKQLVAASYISAAPGAPKP